MLLSEFGFQKDFATEILHVVVLTALAMLGDI